jgi:hypothetical protein
VHQNGGFHLEGQRVDLLGDGARVFGYGILKGGTQGFRGGGVSQMAGQYGSDGAGNVIMRQRCFVGGGRSSDPALRHKCGQGRGRRV